MVESAPTCERNLTERVTVARPRWQSYTAGAKTAAHDRPEIDAALNVQTVVGCDESMAWLSSMDAVMSCVQVMKCTGS